MRRRKLHGNNLCFLYLDLMLASSCRTPVHQAINRFLSDLKGELKSSTGIIEMRDSYEAREEIAARQSYGGSSTQSDIITAILLNLLYNTVTLNTFHPSIRKVPLTTHVSGANLKLQPPVTAALDV